MKLEAIYNLLKKSDLSDFYVPQGLGEIVFIYKEDVGLSLSKIEKDEKIFSYEYFFNSDKSEKENLPDYDKFVRELCKIDNFLNCCNSIYQQEWAIKYNDNIIYIINALNIYNPSSIDFTIPYNLDYYDFEFNFLKMVNEYSSGSKYYQAERIIEEMINKKESTYKDFLEK